MKTSSAARRLDRVLAGLAEDLLVATDVEIREACDELGIDPSMKGSAAFAGLRHFDVLREVRQYLREIAEQRTRAAAKSGSRKRKSSTSRRARPRERTDDDG